MDWPDPWKYWGDQSTWPRIALVLAQKLLHPRLFASLGKTRTFDCLTTFTLFYNSSRITSLSSFIMISMFPIMLCCDNSVHWPGGQDCTWQFLKEALFFMAFREKDLLFSPIVGKFLPVKKENTRFYRLKLFRVCGFFRGITLMTSAHVSGI